MIKAGCFITVLLTFLALGRVSAQSHVTKAGSLCKYAKNSLRGKHINREGHTQCPACDMEDEKERVARIAEDKRRDDVRAAKVAADNLAKQLADEAARKKKREEEKGVTELAVTMPATKGGQSTPQSDVAVAENGMKPGYFYDEAETDNQSLSDMIYNINQGERNNRIYKLYKDVNYFVLNNKRILDNDEFRVCIGVRAASYFKEKNEANCPPGVGIVILNETAENHVIADLVDATGKRLLNDDNISAIVHFADNYFILLEGKYYGVGSSPHTSYRFPNGVIYNHKTKARTPIQNYQLGNRSYVELAWVVNGTYLDKKKLRDKSTYKSYVEVMTGNRQSLIYYITNDGKLEFDEISY